MESRERIEKTADELSEKAFEFYKVINTLNFHSPQEAADDLKYSAGDLIKEMKQCVRYLHHALIGEMGRRGIPPALEEELSDMNEYLDALRHCSGDSRSHQHFLSILIPLFALLKKWAEEGVGI